MLDADDRDELIQSVRLVGTAERWIAVDLVVGAVAVTAWIVATAGGAATLSRAFDLATPFVGAPWTLPAVVAAAVCWFGLPALVAVLRVRAGLLNLHDNVEKHYRFARPAPLLMPPAAVFALGLVALAVGVAPIAVAGVTAVAGVYFLVRANAYCYRVYAVSRPLLLQAGTWAAFAVQIAGVLAYVARRRGHDAAVAATADLAGVPASALEPVAFGVGTVPGPILVAALAPGAVVGAYLVVQTLGALLVRLRRPDVDRRSMRSGQRYPPFLDDAPARPVTHRTPSTGTTVSSTGTTASSSGATGASTGTGGPSSGSTASSNDPVTPGTRPAAGDGGTAAGTGSSASDASGRAPAEETPDADAGAGPTPVDADDASATDLDDVSHTRVFSPSSLDDDGAHQPTVECQACGQEVGAGLAECPHCGDDVWP